MKRIPILCIAVALLAACGPNRDKEIKTIEQHELELSAIDISADNAEAVEMVNLYNQFAEHFPEDSLAPVYMMRAADICINIGNTEEAVNTLDSIMAQYPGFEDIAGCMFMKGYAYEQNEQYEEAREAYSTFVENYPDHYLASDTRKMLPFVGLSPEETLEALLNNATDSNLALK